MVFESFWKGVFSVVKMNATSRKNSFRRSFWYRLQVLTPNSLRERWDWRWKFVVVCGQRVIRTHFPYIPFTSLVVLKQQQTPIFNPIVLEGYWELEPRTGTKMTARTCTFCSFVVFWHWKTNFSHTLEKLGHFASDFRSKSVEKKWVWTEIAENHRELSKISDTIFYEAQQHTWTPYSPNMKRVRPIARFLQPGQISKPLFSCGCTGSATGTGQWWGKHALTLRK